AARARPVGRAVLPVGELPVPGDSPLPPVPGRDRELAAGAAVAGGRARLRPARPARSASRPGPRRLALGGSADAGAARAAARAARRPGAFRLGGAGPGSGPGARRLVRSAPALGRTAALPRRRRDVGAGGRSRRPPLLRTGS